MGFVKEVLHPIQHGHRRPEAFAIWHCFVTCPWKTCDDGGRGNPYRGGCIQSYYLHVLYFPHAVSTSPFSSSFIPYQRLFCYFGCLTPPSLSCLPLQSDCFLTHHSNSDVCANFPFSLQRTRSHHTPHSHGTIPSPSLTFCLNEKRVLLSLISVQYSGGSAQVGLRSDKN